MAQSNRKPWSFGLLGGKSGTKSIVVFFIFLLIGIFTHIGGAVYTELKDRRERPVLALKSVLRDVREYIRIEKKVPLTFRDVEIKVWNKGDDKKTSILLGDHILTTDFYEYFLFSGKVKDVNVINVWAIPLGKYRDEYETVLLVIAAEGEEVWRGPAFSDAQRKFVLQKGFDPKKNFTPTFAEMSELNMKKDVREQPKQKQGISPFK